MTPHQSAYPRTSDVGGRLYPSTPLQPHSRKPLDNENASGAMIFASVAVVALSASWMSAMGKLAHLHAAADV